MHELLTHAPFEQRKWLLGRMLERLGPEEIVLIGDVETFRVLPRMIVPLRLPELVAFYRHLRRLILASLKPPVA